MKDDQHLNPAQDLTHLVGTVPRPSSEAQTTSAQNGQVRQVWQAQTVWPGGWQVQPVWHVELSGTHLLPGTSRAHPTRADPETKEADTDAADRQADDVPAMPARAVDVKLDALGAIVNSGWQREAPQAAEEAQGPTPADCQRARRSLTARILLGSAFQVYTPVTAWLLRKVVEWLESDLYGVVIYGWSRIGKTCAVRWALKRLSSKLEFPVPYAEIGCRSPDESLPDFLRHVLNCLGHRYVQSGRASTIRDRIEASLIVRAQRCPIRTFILFFDEAQLLSHAHMQWLWTLSNELNRQQCRLFCLLVGQRSMLDFKDAWLNTTEEQIITRFMSEAAELFGLRSEEELRRCLNGFQKAEWPQKSGVTFPQNFIADASWELGDLAKPFWTGFAAQWAQAQLPGSPEVGMTYVARAMTRLLNDAAKSGVNTFPTAEVITQAVTSANFEVAIHIRLKAPVLPATVA